MLQHPKAEPVFADYPGAVFVDEKLSYPAAMKHFVAYVCEYTNDEASYGVVLMIRYPRITFDEYKAQSVHQKCLVGLTTKDVSSW